MAFGTGLAIYLVIWWIVLFAVLPWGVRSQAEEGGYLPGSAESAPANPRLLAKAIATTLVSGLVFGVVYVLLVYRPITLDDLPL